MPTLKVRCPECDAIVRHEVESVDEETEISLTCRKCDHKFTTTIEPDEDERPSKGKNAKGTRNRGKGEKKSNSTMLAISIIGGVVVAAGIIAAIALSGGKDKEKDQAKVEPPSKVQPKVRPNPNPNPHPNPNPNPVPNPNPNPNPDPMPMPPDNPVPAPELLPEEDVFVRVATFKPEGPLPELPPLPPLDRRPILVLDPGGHTAFVKNTFFTPDGDCVITIGEDKAIRFWDIATGDVIETITLPAGPAAEGTPQAAALSPDGKRLAVGVFPMGRGKLGIPIYILSTETGELEKVVTGAREVPNSLDFSPDGKYLGVGCGNGVVQVIEIENSKRAYEVPGHPKAVKQLRFHPKQPLLATVGGEREVKIWSLADNTKPTATLPLPAQGPNTIDWSSDGKMLAVGCTSGEVYLTEPTGKPIRTLPPLMERPGAAMQIVRMKFLPGDKQLVYGGIAASGWAGIIEVDTGKRPVTMKEHTNTVMAATCSPNGELAATSGGELNETIIWNVADGKVIRKLAASSRTVWAVGWAKDGKSIAWGNTNLYGPEGLCALERTLRFDDFGIGGKPQPPAYQRHVRFDGTYSIKVENFFEFTVLENGKPLYKHKAAPDGNRIYSVSIIPGKGILVGASFSMYLIDFKTGNLVRRFLGDGGLTTAIAPSPDGRYIMTGSTDQVIRIWSPDQVEPLLSIFALNREWIAWTPQGYYACSAYGERLIGWQVNNGIDKLPEVHPAARFRASLFQPDMIKYLIPAGNMRLALAMAAKFDSQLIAVTDLAAVLPPSVVLTAPTTAANNPITVKATGTSNAKNPIVSMRLLVDGRPYEGSTGLKKFEPAQEKTEATWQVALTPGPHTIAVLAESAVSKGMSNTVTCTRPGKAQVPNLFVLAVGVSDYPNPMKLNYAASDATLLTETLKQHSKSVFGTIEVKIVTDKDATRKGILEGLDWLKSKMTTKDVGIFSFSGHGARDAKTGQFYLVPVDVTNDFAKSCVSGEEFKVRLGNMPGKLVAILDACHSGAAAGPSTGPPAKGPKGPKPLAGRADNLVRDLVTDDYGVVVMCSSLGKEYSLESPVTKAGFFTLGLAEGLSGKADFNGDGVVYIHELDAYAALRVVQLSGGQQNPTTGRPPTIRPFPLAKR